MPRVHAELVPAEMVKLLVVAQAADEFYVYGAMRALREATRSVSMDTISRRRTTPGKGPAT